MSDKILKKDAIIKNIDTNYLHLVEKKLVFFKDAIQKTTIHVKKNKTLDILGVSDVSICIEKLGDINGRVKKIMEDYNTDNTELIINNLQIINNELSSIFKNYGTDSLDDLLQVCFGGNNKITNNETEVLKLDILKIYLYSM